MKYENEHKFTELADRLESLDPERYALIIERCRNGEYHDFKSSMATPKMQMVSDLRDQDRNDIAQKVINGEYDQ